MNTLTPEPHTPTPLQERIARAMWAGFAADQGYTTSWGELPGHVQGTYLHAAADIARQKRDELFGEFAGKG